MRSHIVHPEPLTNLAAQYYRVEKAQRERTLRISLDRLNRAGRELELADRAIDLGISLEALLLHDLGSKDRGELRNRLGIRGAWLLGKNTEERLSVFKDIRLLYDLRSSAVHCGEVERSPKNKEELAKGLITCQRLIIAMINRACEIEWDRAILGDGLDM